MTNCARPETPSVIFLLVTAVTTYTKVGLYVLFLYWLISCSVIISLVSAMTTCAGHSSVIFLPVPAVTTQVRHTQCSVFTCASCDKLYGVGFSTRYFFLLNSLSVITLLVPAMTIHSQWQAVTTYAVLCFVLIISSLILLSILILRDSSIILLFSILNSKLHFEGRSISFDQKNSFYQFLKKA